LQAKRFYKIPDAKNIYEKPGYPLMYVKGGTTGFWGLTRNVISGLNNKGDWVAVLLDSDISGYVVTKEDVNMMIKCGVLHPGHDGDYKLNEGGHELQGSIKHFTFKDLDSAIRHH
jgi:hypothetical protein